MNVPTGLNIKLILVQTHIKVAIKSISVVTYINFEFFNFSNIIAHPHTLLLVLFFLLEQNAMFIVQLPSTSKLLI
ncbi:hypothetical protein IV36_GL001164 [Liquorilactobacillus mali]|uniref:Uncharacterized protein n=1 Tax=Liquorilactobacillus mali TaxID=1618 RepID=A0A0R2FEV9_9LACO|nr:hypothetical protein IV36_GL001164 [Liquorilactobacillus mali]